MDALSAAASLIATIQLAQSLAQVLKNYYANNRDARLDIQKLHDEVTSFAAILSAVNDITLPPEDIPQLPILLQEEVNGLNQLISKLQPRTKIRQALVWPLKKEETAETVARIEAYKSTLLLIAGAYLVGLDDAKKGNIEEDIEEYRRAIINWLAHSFPDPAIYQSSAIYKHHTATGSWLLESPEVQAWLKTPNSYLWLNGKAGSGKSILCSNLIAYVHNYVQKQCTEGSKSVALYWYFSFRDIETQRVSNLLRYMVNLILKRRQDIPDAVQRSYEQSNLGQQIPTRTSLMHMLLEVMDGFDDIYLLLDALDECPTFDNGRNILLSTLREIQSQKIDSLHIFTTSRKETDIKDAYQEMAKGTSTGQYQNIDLDSHKVQIAQDIQAFTHNELQAPKFSRWSPKVKKLAEERLSARAGGVFRWVALQLDDLAHLRSERSISRSLDAVPRSLDEIYDRILDQIPSEARDDVKLALQWLACSTRPLRLEELAEALVVEPMKNGYIDQANRFLDPATLLDIIPSSLISTVEVDDNHHNAPKSDHPDTSSVISPRQTLIQFSHFSVQEYLTSSRISTGLSRFYHVDLLTANTMAAMTCFAYMLYAGEQQHTIPQQLQEELIFLNYAANCWPLHMSGLEEVHNPSLDKIALTFLKCPSPAWTIWSLFGFNDEDYKFVGVSTENLSDRYPRKLPGPSLVQPITWVSGLGLTVLSELLLSDGLDLNDVPRTKYLGSPLYAAAMAGRTRVVQSLLRAGADINREGGPFGNALQAALYSGHMEVIRLLLHEGADDSQLLERADVNARGGCYGTALQAASYSGHTEIVQLLLDKQADVNICGGAFGSALQAASYRGHEAIIKLLLEHDADPDALGGTFGTSLQAAAYRGHVQSVRLLLSKEANINIRGGIYGTALQAAFAGAQKDVVAVLLRAGAEDTEDASWTSRSSTLPATTVYEPHLAGTDGKDQNELDNLEAIQRMLNNWLARESTNESEMSQTTPTSFMESAVIHPLLDDSTIRLSFHTALGDGKLSNLFERNLVRLLKCFSMDLKKEANGWLQIDISKLIWANASIIAATITGVVKASIRGQIESAKQIDQLGLYLQQQNGSFVPEITLHLPLPDVLRNSGENYSVDLEVPEPGPDHIAQIQLFLGNSQAMKEFKNNLRTLVFKQVNQYIRTTLLAAGVPETGNSTISCSATWEIIEYCQSQLSKTSDLGNVLTITGSPTHALAAASSRYMAEMWGHASSKLLEQLKLGFEGHSCRMKFSDTHELYISFHPKDSKTNEPENARISLSGSIDELVNRMEQLSWCAASFRTPLAEGLSMSTIMFEAVPSSDLLEPGFKFKLSIISPKPVHKSSDKDPPLGQCWLPLFKQSTLACGFPIPARPAQASGLQLEFSLLALLAQIEGPIDYDGGIVFVGPSKILFPTFEIESSFQWHFAEVDDALDMFKILNELNWKQEPDLERLTTSRVYLGYCQHAQVLTGTEKLIESHDIQASEVHSSPSYWSIARKANVSTTVSAKGIWNAGISGEVVLSRGQQMNVDSSNGQPRDWRHQSSEQPVLVYDNEAKCGWLVSELGVILHLAHSYLRQEWVQKLKDPTSPMATFEFAEVQSDGGEAAFEAVKKSNSTKLGLDDKEEKFGNLVDKYISLFGLIRKQVSLEQASAGKRFFSRPLQGWDFVDLRNKEHLFYQRELPNDDQTFSWWKLAETPGMVVIFGKNFGQLIRPDASKSPVCSAWLRVPEGAGLLTASMHCVKQLAGKTNENTDKNDPYHWLLASKKLEWHAPEGFSMFDYCQSKGSGCSCVPIQELWEPSILKPKKFWKKRNPPKQIEKDGAVIFGSVSYYQQIMREKAENLTPDLLQPKILTRSRGKSPGSLKSLLGSGSKESLLLGGKPPGQIQHSQSTDGRTPSPGAPHHQHIDYQAQDRQAENHEVPDHQNQTQQYAYHQPEIGHKSSLSNTYIAPENGAPSSLNSNQPIVHASGSNTDMSLSAIPQNSSINDTNPHHMNSLSSLRSESRSPNLPSPSPQSHEQPRAFGVLLQARRTDPQRVESQKETESLTGGTISAREKDDNAAKARNKEDKAVAIPMTVWVIALLVAWILMREFV